MKRILKYKLAPQSSQYIDLPAGSRILTAQRQGTDLCLWAECTESEAIVPVTVLIYGTGFPFPAGGLDYLCTVQDGAFVWHIYLDMRVLKLTQTAEEV